MTEIQEGKPLVTVLVITYNSARFVAETLESIKNQTYENLELIVSDDCSTDETAILCTDWILENKRRFVRSQFISIEKNTGIPANCNRGILAAKGEWVKLIAGDDLLFSTCIEKNIEAANKNTPIILSELINFSNSEGLSLDKQQTSSDINPLFIKLNSARSQFIYFLKGFWIPGSAIFLNRSNLLMLGLFDERYNLVEDIPLVLKYTWNGIKIKYISEVLIAHRKHEAGLTAKHLDRILPDYLKQVYEVIGDYSSKHKNFIYILNSEWHKILIALIFSFGNKGSFCQFMNQIRVRFQPVRFLNFVNWLKLKV